MENLVDEELLGDAPQVQDENAAVPSNRLAVYAPSRLSKRRRRFYRRTVLEEIEYRDLTSALIKVSALLSVADAAQPEGYDQGDETAPRLWQILQAIHARLRELDTVSLANSRLGSKIVQPYETVLEARSIFGDQLFVHVFGLQPPEVVRMSSLLFDGVSLIQSSETAKKGKINAQLATLLVLCRFRMVSSTLELMASLFGRDEAWVSTFARLAVKRIVHRHARLLNKRHFSWKFKKFIPSWKKAIAAKYDKLYRRHVGEEMSAQIHGVVQIPSRFRGVSVFLDCVRTPVARPSYAQDRFYNGWLGYHSLIRPVISSPCGLFLYAPRGLAGHNNDSAAAATHDVNTVLGSIDAKALADKGFYTMTHIAAFERTATATTFEHQQYALSAMRTAGCEWPFGHMEMLFPELVQQNKQQLLLTAPEVFFEAGMIISNLINLMRGRQNHLFFGLRPPFTPEHYIKYEKVKDVDVLIPDPAV
jgi:hypothetical protein